MTAHNGWSIYSVDTAAVRCVAQPDEEFGNFASRDQFPNLIPEGEIWIGAKNLNKEGVFFIADALARFTARDKGAPDETAYTAGLNTERGLRESLNGLKFRAGRPHKRVPPDLYIEHYITLADHKFPIEVWLIDGNLVRSLYKTDYTEGGHGYVYRWVPRHEIWIEKDLDRWELPFIVSHEYLELRLMRDEKIDYDTAHAICSKVEFNFRKGRGGKAILAPGRQRLKKSDLVRLTKDEIFEYVLRTYVNKKK